MSIIFTVASEMRRMKKRAKKRTTQRVGYRDDKVKGRHKLKHAPQKEALLNVRWGSR